MGTTFLGDIPNGELTGPVSTFASVASAGASSQAVIPWRAPQKIKLTSALFAPDTVIQNSTGATASYRRITLINGGQLGTGTVVLGSINLNASQDSLATRAFTLASNPTMTKGDVLITKQETVGAADAEGTVLRAGMVQANFLPR